MKRASVLKWAHRSLITYRMKTYLEVLKKYAVFTGRARRKEYWLFFLVNTIISILIGAVLGVIGLEELAMPVGIIYALVMLLPNLGVTFRRLHDTGRSGWWLLILLVPFVGVIVFFVFMALDSQPGDNKYGPNPKGVAGPAIPAVPAI